MSNKNKDKGKSQEPIVTLASAETVQVLLPAHLEAPDIKQDILKYYVQASLSKRKVSLKEPLSVKFFGRDETVKVVSITLFGGQPASENDYYSVGVKTSIVISFPEQKKQTISKEIPKFYGHNSEYDSFRKIVWENFKLREELFKVQLGTIRGILLSGPSGTGKSTFIKRLQYES